MKILLLAIAVIGSALVIGPPALAESVYPIYVGGDTQFDACGSLGEVTGLRVDGNGFLAVRAGPGTGYEKIDDLINGDRVFVCDEREVEGEKWIGVVYPKAWRDCGVSSPRLRREYNGPCPSGWVRLKWTNLVAG